MEKRQDTFGTFIQKLQAFKGLPYVMTQIKSFLSAFFSFFSSQSINDRINLF